MEERRDKGGVTLETDTVPFQTLHGLLEKVLASRGHAGHIVLVPFDGCIDMLKDFFHGIGDFSANTITGYEGHLLGANVSDTREQGRGLNGDARYTRHRTWSTRIFDNTFQIGDRRMSIRTLWVIFGEPADRVVAALWQNKLDGAPRQEKKNSQSGQLDASPARERCGASLDGLEKTSRTGAKKTSTERTGPEQRETTESGAGPVPIAERAGGTARWLLSCCHVVIIQSLI